MSTNLNCDQWRVNRTKVPIINPLTNRVLTLGGPRYKELDKMCNISSQEISSSTFTTPNRTPGSSIAITHTSKHYETPTSEAKQIVLGTTDNGNMFWICGPPTFTYKAKITALGGRWNATQKCWIMPTTNLQSVIDLFVSNGVNVDSSNIAVPVSKPASSGPEVSSSSSTSATSTITPMAMVTPMAIPMAMPMPVTMSRDMSIVKPVTMSRAMPMAMPIPRKTQKTVTISTDGNDKLYICGSDTYGLKDLLKKDYSAKWDASRRCWLIHPSLKDLLIAHLRANDYAWTN